MLYILPYIVAGAVLGVIFMLGIIVMILDEDAKALLKIREDKHG